MGVGQTIPQIITYFYVNETISVSEHRAPSYKFQLAMVSSTAYCTHITLFFRLRDWDPSKCWGPLAVAQSAPPLIRHWPGPTKK